MSTVNYDVKLSKTSPKKSWECVCH